MKEYEKYVVWLDYFNSELKRSDGRRVPLSLATRAPTLDELVEASKRLSLQPVEQVARYPNSASRQSGYVSVIKQKPKHSLVSKLAKELAYVRGQAQKRQAQGRQGQKR